MGKPDWVRDYSRREFIIASMVAGGFLLTEPLLRVLAEGGGDDPEGKEKEPRNFLICRANFKAIPVYGRNHRTNELLRFDPISEILAGAVFQITDVGGGWGLVHPDNGLYHQWYEEGDGIRNVYVHLEHFTQINPEELTPITINKDTRNLDKQVVVNYNGTHPYALYLEGDQIIAKIPVGIGGYWSAPKTFVGEYRVSISRISRHMRTLHGVPFVSYFNANLGQAFHGTPWRDPWNKGFFGTAGCINQPNYSEKNPFNVMWAGNEIGFDHFVFRWMATNLPHDPTTDDRYEVHSTDPGWYEGTTSLRTLVVKRLADLHNFLPHPTKKGTFSSWQPLIDATQALESDFILPRNLNGETSFERLSFGA